MSDPDRIGKYEIRSVLGRGAMGVVYRAFDPQIEREVAVKTVRKDLVDPEIAFQLMARFKNEARAAGRLLHPNIVTVYEYGEDDATAYIAMEFVEGIGLREYLNRKIALGVPQILSIMSQLMLALHFAHERGVVHRDIKPPNLILTPEGALKIADFGIARIDTSNLTTVGMVVGTPSYMSPEQCQGLELDRRSDLFSAGIVLYELLTGAQPFAGSLETIVYKICHQDPEPPSRVSKLSLSPGVDALLARALAKKPDARYTNAAEFHQALRAAFDAAPVPVDVADDMTRMGPVASPLQPVPLPAWNDAVLGTVERQLAQFVGPMAKVMVRKAATQAHDLAQLYALLSEKIGTAPERQRFVGGLRDAEATGSQAQATPSHASTRQAPGVGGSTAGGTSSASTASATADRAAVPSVPLDQAFIDRAVTKLAVHLGPIAKVVAKRAAQQTTSQHEFVRILAGHLGTQERGTFLRDLGINGVRLD